MSRRLARWPLDLVAAACIAMSPAATIAAPDDASKLVLPPNVSKLSDIGERAAFSPDSRKVAFVNHEFGDAYEIDLASGDVRNLTGHLPHMGITRVQYLPSGDYLITAPRYSGKDARFRAELWVLDKGLRRPLQPLGVNAFEGTAVSRLTPRIAWVSISPKFHLPGPGPNGAYGMPPATADDAMMIEVADIEYGGGRPKLTNRREVLRVPSQKCYLEVQDFREQDKSLVYSCYGIVPYGGLARTPTLGVDIASGRITTFRDDPREINEPEGIFPDGKATLTECKPVPSDKPVELCRLGLTEKSTDYRRLTSFSDHSAYGASNGVISPDGRLMAFQLARSDGAAGQGFGLMLMQLER
ncbi:hypothetical protein [Sphingomonas profundi]|uniref:hypothetical protein n=1 Tax=Alterirhizorhabdus profundi TaxID=2681549 RepID=UPI0012E977F7|nr:hypothetical protein [Sphingomonas profundi]